jgi:hypothetical protein
LVISGQPHQRRTGSGIGPAPVDGQIDDTLHFSDIVGAAAPRMVQLVAKFSL